MKTKQYILVCVLLFMSTVVFAASIRRIYFEISNYSSNDIVVNAEFWEKSNDKEYDGSWVQEIAGLRVTIVDFMSRVHRNVSKPYTGLTVIYYYPFDSRYEHRYAYKLLDEIPFMEIMKAIFKKLEIVCDNGEHVITLDDLENQIIKLWGDSYVLEVYEDRNSMINIDDLKEKSINEGGNPYILGIFDSDAEGKPASEW